MEKPKHTARGGKLINYKNSLSLITRQKEILVGLLLGDVSAQSQDKGKTYRLKFEYGGLNEKYCKHLYQEFQEWCLSDVREVQRKNSNDNVVTTWAFQTLSHSEFKFYGDLFYSNKTKVIRSDLLEALITPLSLSYWFIDDGSKMDFTKNTGKGFHLHTQCFSEQEVEKLCEILNRKFHLKCWKGKNKNKPIIVISGRSYEAFLKLIKPYLIPSMKRKLPDSRKI